MTVPNRYEQIIERIFLSHYKPGSEEVLFEREDIVRIAKKLKIELPKNLGDLIYSFRYRISLPTAVSDLAPKGKKWIIRPAGRSKYGFVAVSFTTIVPNPSLIETRVPNATPGVIEMYALSDEQALLAKVRYNRLVDIFTGLTCYSLQNHLRTTVPDLGQIETDEIYVGLDRRGSHYIISVQAKGGRDQLNVVQIEQDFAMCSAKFPNLICQPIGAQFMDSDLIAIFAFEKSSSEVRISREKHYRLVPPESITEDELKNYSRLPLDD